MRADWWGYLLAPHIDGLDAQPPHRPTDVLHAAEDRVEACIALHTHHGTRATRASGRRGGLASYGTRAQAQQSARSIEGAHNEWEIRHHCEATGTSAARPQRPMRESPDMRMRRTCMVMREGEHRTCTTQTSCPPKRERETETWQPQDWSGTIHSPGRSRQPSSGQLKARALLCSHT